MVIAPFLWANRKELRMAEYNADANSSKKNFDFVDTIRCISMMGIVWEHSSAISIDLYTDKTSLLVQSFSLQAFKFVTIAFFLIGGFLINHKFQEYSAKQYLKNRFKNTIKPWLFWMLLFVALTIIDRLVAWHKGSDVGLLSTNFPLYFYKLMNMTLFFSPYWFILNFLICIAILLVFKRYLYKTWFGIILALLSLTYSLNLHFRWFETTHSAALFGFVFYLWLGVYLNRYFEAFKQWVARLSWGVIWTGIIITLALSMAESFYLLDTGLKDAYNTLRITNILYSLIVFVALFKMGPIKAIQHLHPRQTTFGIYLIHFIILERILYMVFQPLALDFSQFNIWENTGITFARFLVAYVSSFYITLLLNRTKLKWMVGQ
jgi:probable poly-beta-1,6-N-acetyl-D-glucosamine export protein